MGKRLLALFLATLFLVFSLSFTVLAKTDTSSKKKIQETKPTEPPFTVEGLGYDNYINRLEKHIYLKEMGAIYTKKSTFFKLWSPTAERVKVCIYKTGSDEEEGAEQIIEKTMVYSEYFGSWYLELFGDYKNKYYTYKVTNNGVEYEIVDPNAKACGINGQRGMIVDLDSTDPKGWENDKFDRVNASFTEAMIWEVNVRDFSNSTTSGVSEKNRGKFLAFTEEGTTVDSVEGELSTCIDYLKGLGVNYVQLNPIYDFNSIDESKDLDDQYNWGYDPLNYNCVEGSYSSNPYDGNVRIKECKEMILALHNAGIGVIMDVVYNHTALSQDSNFNIAVPNYYYRYDDNMNFSNGSGCGNDTASEHIMYREFMKNSVMFWAKEYHIDGFRFDLMGLHDVITMNYIRQNLDKLDDGARILMYGEGWKLDTSAKSDVVLATQDNCKKLQNRIGCFNDTIRDGAVGSAMNKGEEGYVQSGSTKSKIRSSIEGLCIDSWSKSPNQVVNYVSCHDNLTLYDKLVDSVKKDESYTVRDENLLSMNKLAASIVYMSQGLPFMLAGEEMGRTKEGDSNSYSSKVSVNEINWNNVYKYNELVKYYEGLIKIRKALDIFKCSDTTVSNKIKYLENTPGDVIGFKIEDYLNTKKFICIFNPNDKAQNVSLSDKDNFVIIANDKKAGLCNLGNVDSGMVTVAPYSSCILVDRLTFESVCEESKCTVYVNYYDDGGKIFYQDILTGTLGDVYSVDVPTSLSFKYDVLTNSGNTSGEFKDEDIVVKLNFKEYTGKFSNVVFKYVDENDKELSSSQVLSNRVGQQYYTPTIKSIKGYSLDLDKLPNNGAGKFKDDDITVIYRYKKGEKEVDKDSLENKNDELTCPCNLIYMGSDGKILDKKSYLGRKGDIINIDTLTFDGYTFISNSYENAKFSNIETNIVLSYHKDEIEFNSTLVVVGSAILFVVILFIVLFFITRKKSKKDEMVIEDDFII